MGRSEVYVAAIFYGQGKPDPNDIASLAKVLDLPEAVRVFSFSLRE